MLIDCFCFNNELDVLEVRLQELYDLVDYFVLVESDKTQSLENKPLHFQRNKERFLPFSDKIIHHIVQNVPDNLIMPWGFDIYQRDCIQLGLKAINARYEDIVLISDVDEIPKKESLKDNLAKLEDVLVFDMSYNVYYLNLIVENQPWKGTVAVSGETALKNSIHGLIKIRDSVNRCDVERCIPNAGWHFGYQGGRNTVFEKYFACVEPLDKRLIPDIKTFDAVFSERVKDGGSFIFCDNLCRKDLKLKVVENKTLPSNVIDNLEKYKEMLWTK